MALVSSDRSGLIPAVRQSQRLQSWDNTIEVEISELCSAAERAPCLLAPCHGSEDLKPGPREISSCLQRGGEKKIIKLP